MSSIIGISVGLERRVASIGLFGKKQSDQRENDDRIGSGGEQGVRGRSVLARSKDDGLPNHRNNASVDHKLDDLAGLVLPNVCKHRVVHFDDDEQKEPSVYETDDDEWVRNVAGAYGFEYLERQINDAYRNSTP